MATIQLPPDFKEFLKLLNSNKVEYLVVGGYAVNYYGYPRATADLDIWIAIHPINAQRLADVIQQFGFARVQSETFLEPRKVIRMGVPPVRLEILTSISGVEFADCYRRRAGRFEARLPSLRICRQKGERVALRSFDRPEVSFIHCQDFEDS